MHIKIVTPAFFWFPYFSSFILWFSTFQILCFKRVSCDTCYIMMIFIQHENHCPLSGEFNSLTIKQSLTFQNSFQPSYFTFSIYHAFLVSFSTFFWREEILSPPVNIIYSIFILLVVTSNKVRPKPRLIFHDLYLRYSNFNSIFLVSHSFHLYFCGGN